MTKNKTTADKKKPWSLDELRKLITEIHGSNQRELTNIHINSVATKLNQANYHAWLARDCLEKVFLNDQSPSFVMGLILGANEKSSDFQEARFISEANIIACAHTMHSIADVLAHLINDALALGFDDDELLDLKTANKKLPPNSNLRRQVECLLGMHQFDYLRAFVNTSKHVSLIDSGYHVNLENGVKHGILFRKFTYKQREYKAKWSEEFIDDMSAIAKTYQCIGIAINDHLKSLLSTKPDDE